MNNQQALFYNQQQNQGNLIQHQAQHNISGLPQQSSQFGGQNYPLSGIGYPGQNDVMCGRGGATNNHIGNIRFRQLVNEYKLRYLAASKAEKPKVAMLVVQMWRQLSPPGRFLTKTQSNHGDSSTWHDVGDKKAREKASQCLRERTPEAKNLMGNTKDDKDTQIVKEPTKKPSRPKKKSQRYSQDSKQPNQTQSEESRSVGQQTKLSITETLESVAKSDNAMSTATPLSIQTPDITVSTSDSNTDGMKSRDQIANRIPTAAALMSNVFEDDDNDQTFSFDNDQDRHHGFLELTPKLENEDECSIMDGDSKDWVKSFESIGSASTNMLMSVANSSLHGGSDIPPREAASKHQETSSKASLRSKTKTTNHNLSSNMSVTSELTDLSAGVKDLGLDRR